jgi:PIN domain nuclease of toxin-antitoxin system
VTEPVLLDTCACLWLSHGDTMSEASRRAIREAQLSSAGVHLSPITAWEVAMLVAKGRYRLSVSPKVWLGRLLGLPGMRLAGLTTDILIDSASLPGDPPNDPADRIIAATARQYGHLVITRDSGLIPYGAHGHLKVLAC